MRRIEKKKEPAYLKRWKKARLKAGQSLAYNELPGEVMRQLRIDLNEEQGGLCAYCLQRIFLPDEHKSTQSKQKIEHWCPRNPIGEHTCWEGHEVDYQNLLAVCGGEYFQEGKGTILHCDRSKGNLPIKYNPSHPLFHEDASIRYTGRGTVVSKDPIFNRELDEVLNLNLDFPLRYNRKRFLDDLITYITKKYPNRALTKAEIAREISFWKSQDTEGQLKEFCDVALYFYQKMTPAENQK